MMPETTRTFDRLVSALESLAPKTGRPEDAIDRILAAAPRRTEARSLRDDPVVARFREDLANGLIRMETADALFRLIGEVINRYAGV
ncbi:MAG: hypothetical protein V3W34_16825 [Phycisphaerae bacterium]